MERKWPQHGEVVDFVTRDGKYHSGVYDKVKEIFWAEMALAGISEPRPYNVPEGSEVYSQGGILEWDAHKEMR